MENSPSIPDWITAVAAALTLAIAVIALVYARGQLREAARSRQQARDLDRERSQPYVVAVMEHDATDPGFVDLVIRNYGQTAARDVVLVVSPPLMRTSWDSSGEAEPVAVPDVIPVLAPGQEWRTFWDGHERSESELPDRHEGTVRYRGIDESELETRVVLDWSLYKSRHYLVRRSLHHLAESTREIEKTLAGWSERSGSRGLKVYQRDGDAKDDRDRAAFDEQRRRWEERRLQRQESPRSSEGDG